MTKKIASFIVLLFALNVVPLLSAEPTYINVSGTIKQPNGEVAQYAQIVAIDSNGRKIKNTTSGATGDFKFTEIPSDATIGISHMGQTMKIPVQEHMDIDLPGNKLSEVVIQDSKSCDNLTGAIWSDKQNKCVCKKQGQVIRNKVCVDFIEDLDFTDADSMISESETVPGKVLQYENEKAACKEISDATWDNGKCVCKNSDYIIDGKKCVKPNKTKAGTECSARHGTGKYNDKKKCILEKCNDDSYKLNKEKNTCEKINTRKLNRQECAKDNSKKWQNGECVDKCDSSASWDDSIKKCVCEGPDEKMEHGKCVDIDDDYTEPVDTRTDEQKAQELEEKKAAYEKAKETAQSKENRMLTGLSMAATGIGGMELAQGMAEQKADKEAEQSMSAYIATMRCKYGKDKQVKAGQTEIELPGGNDANIMKYRNEYIALATDLKTRKNAMGLAAGIESEEILDKAQMNLYSQENLGITDGAYSSLYRAQMYDSENDKAQIADAKQTSKNRVIGGAVAAGVGVVGGIVGDQMINGNLGNLIKQNKTISVLDKNKTVEILSDEEIRNIGRTIYNTPLEGDQQ